MAHGWLYRIDAPDGRSYIGITRNTPEKRFQQHVHGMKRWCSPLCEAFVTFGAKQMRLTVLAKLEAAELASTEQRAIAAFDTFWPNGLNSTPGGNGVVRSIPNSEANRVRKMRATMATKEYRQKQREVQAIAWTDGLRAKRAEETRARWKDPEYRAKVVAAHKRRKPAQFEMALARPASDAMKRYWADPEWRASLTKARQASITPEYRLRVAQQMTARMQDPAIRLDLGVKAHKYKQARFEKLARPPANHKPSVVTRNWDDLPAVFDVRDTIRLGWKSREIDRAISRGWLRVVA